MYVLGSSFVLILLGFLTSCHYLVYSQKLGIGFHSPLFPRIPNCAIKNRPVLRKRTKKKFLISTMFKDEEGFLAEFVSFYKIHGFDKIILWNHESPDRYMDELMPWISTGFVEIKNTSLLNAHPNVLHAKGSKYWKVIALKKEIERQNFLWAITNKYDFYMTSDIDEYVLPIYNNFIGMPHGVYVEDEGHIEVKNPIPFMSLADTIHSLFYDPYTSTYNPLGNTWKPKLYLPLPKYNYAAVPHTLEPLDLLTVEAYLTRYHRSRGMNYYMNVQPKFVYRISGKDIEGGDVMHEKFYGELDYNEYNKVKFSEMQGFLSNCCFFHGCSRVSKHSKTLCSILGIVFSSYI